MRPGPGSSSPSRRGGGRSRAGSAFGVSLNDLTALLPAHMPPLRWLAPRLALGALLVHLALQLRILQGFFGCVPHSSDSASPKQLPVLNHTTPHPHPHHPRLQRASSPLQRDGGPLCHPYDPVARPGLARIHGLAFNFTSATHKADPERLFQGRGVVMAASGSIMR